MANCLFQVNFAHLCTVYICAQWYFLQFILFPQWSEMRHVQVRTIDSDLGRVVSSPTGQIWHNFWVILDPQNMFEAGLEANILSSDVVCLHITLAQLLKPLLPRDPATESSPQYGCLRPRQIRRLVGIEMDWTIGTLQPGYRCDSQQKGMVDSPGGLETSSVVAAAVLTSNPPIYVELWLQQGLSQLAKGPWSAEILESPSGFAKWQAKPSYWSTQPNLEGSHFHSLNFLACGAVCFFIFAQAVKLWCRSLFGNSFK